MQKLDEVVDLYLNMDTNYALMITGEWGIGKTHYFKNHLQKQILDTPVFNDQTKKYKPIHISMFGLKNIEEVQTEILLSLYPILKSKQARLTSGIAKFLLKGFLTLKGLGDFSQIFNDIKIDKADIIDINSIVICFDDLERKSELLLLEELIGFVNSMVEESNAKILIIANEEKIDAGNYHALKEKTIGNTVEFVPNISDAFDGIITKYHASSLYLDFLEKKKLFILDIFSRKSSNFRILIFALSHFQYIYSEIQKNFVDESFLKNCQDKILSELLKFTLAISIEYKLGTLSFRNRHGLDKQVEVDLNYILSQSNATRSSGEKTKAGVFQETYYPNEPYRFYDSIYSFITGGSALKYIELLKELKRNYRDTSEGVQIQYSIYDQLYFGNQFFLSDREYINQTRLLLKYAYEGEFNPSYYASIFYCVFRFKNPLGLSLEKVTRKLINGMKKGAKNYTHEPYLDEVIQIGTNAPYSDYASRIKNAAIEINQNILSKNKAAERQILEKLCHTNFDDFCDLLSNNEDNVQNAPVFKDFSAYRFYLLFRRISNRQKTRFIRLYHKRYQYISSPIFKQEVEFHRNLLEKVKRADERFQGKNLTGQLYSDFHVEINIAINNLNFLDTNVARI